MSKFRSPVLGFNHNIRHRGWLFHVQTEDSGVQNPHIFTHLFRDGVIIATRKVVYDANADVDIVKGLMQAQHKAVLKDLKTGAYDEKIKKYLGEPPEAAQAVAPPIADEPEANQTIQMPPPSFAAVTTATEAPPELMIPDLPAGETLPRGSGPPEQVLAAHGTHPPPPSGVVIPGGGGPSLVPPAYNVPVIGAPPIEPGLAARSSAEYAPTEALDVPPPPPSTSPPATMGPNARQTGGGSFVVSRPNRVERPFEKSGSYAAVPDTRPPAAAPSMPHPRRQATPAHLPEVPEPPPFTPRPTAAKPAAPPPRRPTPAPGMNAQRPSGERPAVARPSQPPIIETRRSPSSPSVQRAPVTPPRTPSQANIPPVTPPAKKAPSQPPAAARAPGTNPPLKPPSESSVVVARPAVVIGAPPISIGGTPPTQPPATAAGARRPTGVGRELSPTTGTADNIFGQDLISEKSLDEVIMAYLSEDSTEE